MPSQTPPNTTKRAARSWVLAVGGVALAVVAVWSLLPHKADKERISSDRKEGEQQPLGAIGGRAEDRLRELRAVHESASGNVPKGPQPGSGSTSPEGGKFDVPARPGAAPAARLKPKIGASVGAGDAAGASDSATYDEPDPDDIPGLKQMALKDPDPDRRLAAVTLLGASDDPQAIPILAEVLNDQDEEVRLAAIQSLADMTGEVPIEVLGNAALNDPSPDNRYEALEALADMAGPAARQYLERALHDPDEDVASLAESLLELGSDEEEPAATPPSAAQMR